MKVILHQAAGVNRKTRFQADFRQGSQKILPVHVIQKNALAAVPLAQDS
jgi:hypothetical protein